MAKWKLSEPMSPLVSKRHPRQGLAKDNQIINFMQSKGCDCRFVRISHLSELREEIESRRRDGFLNEALYQDYLSGVKYQKPFGLADARSIVIVAVPQPPLRVAFHWRGKAYAAIVPPTYYDAQKVAKLARSLLMEGTKGEGWKFVRGRLPLKTLATRSGLTMYGKNNISYVPKYGSFVRLTAFFTDRPCGEDQWQDSHALPLCSTCRKCIEYCPTGAICDDRFLIRAERCLTYLNEMPSSRRFPGWVKPSWHNAIVGCMRCQNVCPYNKEVLGWREDRGKFSEEETAFLLAGSYEGERAKQLNRRLRLLGIDLTIFPRNLAALLKRAP